jgi:FkbM family methyltransferase
MTDYSQHGESSYLQTLFPPNYIGVAVEVGAYNGINGSNTYLFEKKGWKCMCIEPVPEEFEKCKKVRQLSLQYAVSNENKEDVTFTVFTLTGDNKSAISGLVPDQRLISSHNHLIQNIQKIKVKCKTLTSILDENNFPTNLDIVSIDTENTELDVLKGLDLNKYKVKVFVIENNYNENFCENYLSKYGYKKIHRLAVNDFYVKI